MSAINFITSLARKILARESKGITKIPTQMAAEAKAGEIAARLQDAGLPLNRADEFIKSEQDLVRILNMIESTPPVMREVPSGIRSTREAKVFDMEGKEIPKGSQIMGGKKVENTTGSLMSVPNKKGLAGMEYETDAAIKTRLEKSNKKGIANIKNKMTEIDEAIDNASPGFAGDRKYDAQLVADDLAEKRFGKDFYDLDQKQQLDLYDEAYTGLSDSRFKNKPDPEDMATGGRAGFKAGLGKRFLELLKGKPKPKFDVERFREGPIDLKFLENVDKKDLAPFIRSRDTMGPGGYGMYDDFADMPAGLKAAELISRIKTKEGGINYSMAEMFIGKKLKGNESVDELIEMVVTEKKADGGRIGYADGTPDKTSLLDMLDVQASGSKSGKQQIPGAPDGITIDSESLNAIAKADIPISQKVDLILEYKYGKGRDRIEDKGQEILLDEGGYKDQDIGFGYNQGGEGISGSVMRDLRTGDDEFKIRLLKRFANGGRIGLKAGMTKRAFLKLMGTGAAGIAALKSGLLGFGKGAGKQVAEEVVKKSTSTPPAYFFELAEKIKTLGRVTDGPQERLKIHTMPAKDGKSELMLTEDIGTGEMQIKKISKEGDDMVTEVQTMDYTPGSSQADEATQGIPADSYDEYTEFNSRIIKDEYNDPDIVEGIKVDEIIEEVKDQAPSIKKAGGGIARMLGE